MHQGKNRDRKTGREEMYRKEERERDNESNRERKRDRERERKIDLRCEDRRVDG